MSEFGDGYQKGFEDGQLEGYKVGFSQGFDVGYEEGWEGSRIYRLKWEKQLQKGLNDEERQEGKD